MHMSDDDIRTEYLGADVQERVYADNTVMFDLGYGSHNAPHASGRPLTLVLVRERTHEQFEVALPAVIGRGTAATVRLVGNRAISREHVRLEEQGGSLVLIDCGSTNGTRVGGVRVPPGMAVQIAGNEELMFGSEPFRLMRDGQGVGR